MTETGSVTVPVAMTAKAAGGSPNASRRGFANLALLSVAGSVLAVACSTSSPSPSVSNVVPTAPSVVRSTSFNDPATGLQAPTTRSHGIEFTPLVGTGSGTLNVTATANDGGFIAHFQSTVNVHGVPPDTLLYVQLSPDGGLGTQQADGVCQRAGVGLFFPVALYTGGPPATIRSSPGGAGAVHVELHFNAPFFPEGSQGDVVWRLVNALPPAVPTIDLRTPCFKFEIK